MDSLFKTGTYLKCPVVGHQNKFKFSFPRYSTKEIFRRL